MIKLATTEAVAAQIRVKERLKTAGVFTDGYHFCCDCQRVTEDISDGFPKKCCWCGGSRIKYNPKIE